jgi:predicted nicotinamide N-methyase
MADHLDISNLFPVQVQEQKQKEPHSFLIKTKQGNQYDLQLVAEHPLWGHLLWNAGKWLADYLEANRSLYGRKRHPRLTAESLNSGLVPAYLL